jgi:hypothetical protein
MQSLLTEELVAIEMLMGIDCPGSKTTMAESGTQESEASLLMVTFM